MLVTGCAQTPPPHIRDSSSAARIMWTYGLALLPAVIAAVFLFRLEALRIFSAAVVSAVATEMILRKIFRKPERIYDGHSVLTGVLVACMLPASAPTWAAVLGSVFAVGIAKEIFGGPGQYPFHPAMAARAFLEISFLGTAVFPAAQLQGPAADGPSVLEFFLGLGPGAIGETCALALTAGGLLLIFQKLVFWELPVLFLGAFLLASPLAGFDPWTGMSSGGVLLAAFFTVADPGTAPMTRSGKRLSAASAGLLILFLRRWGVSPDGTAFAVLMANAAAPWIDRWTKPARVRRPGRPAAEKIYFP